MKTPLTTAMAYLQLLNETIDKKNKSGTLYAKKAAQSVERLQELVAELLDVSKIQSGKLNYKITRFDFNQLVKNTVENVHTHLHITN